MLNYVLVAVGSPSVLVTLSTPTLTPVTRRPIGKTGTPTCICGVHSSGVVSCTSAATTITLWQHGSGSGGSSAGGGQCVAISRDGKLACRGTSDGWLHVWRTDTGARVHQWRAHYRSVEEVCFGEVGVLYSGGADGSVTTWDISAYPIPFGLKTDTGHTLGVASVYSCSGGVYVSSGLDRTVRRSDDTSENGTVWRLPCAGKSVTASPNGQCVWVGGEDGCVYACSNGGGVVGWKGHAGSVTGIMYVGNFVVSGGVDGTVRCWAAQQGVQVAMWSPGEGSVVGPVFCNTSSDGGSSVEYGSGGDLVRVLRGDIVQGMDVPVVVSGVWRSECYDGDDDGYGEGVDSGEVSKLRSEVARLKQANAKLYALTAEQL